MTPEQFVYWLQGLMELGNPKVLTEEQTAMVKRHLATVFVNVTASPPATGKKEVLLEDDARQKVIDDICRAPEPRAYCSTMDAAWDSLKLC